jgi:hypothetical protein
VSIACQGVFGERRGWSCCCKRMIVEFRILFGFGMERIGRLRAKEECGLLQGRTVYVITTTNDQSIVSMAAAKDEGVKLRELKKSK